ncbi:MIP/aquaporin family protein [Gracilimonas mengyeensis]|uniref:Aquaporin Z n=1 Tax=Gracilimonas mengyeensis TaxID=1302730 RepID=A0A521CUH3_9BACT|nr:aquaporin [Gracilimonas mengyeensis]SMO63107.1 aquaporin Z [Gracilimonas mengyeensis]
MKSYVMEAIGAFFLVLVYGFTSDALAVGLTLMALIYIGFKVSGAHYNPAVSIAFFLQRKISGADLAGYVAAQLIGGFLSAGALFFLSSGVFYLDPPPSTDLYQQAFAEVGFTFLFVMVMLTFSLPKSPRNFQTVGLAAGLTFTGILLAGTPVSGGVFNPAISIGTALFDLLSGGNSYVHALLYTLAPVAGGSIAAGLYSYLYSGNK